MKNLLRRNLLVLMLGVTTVAFIMPALHTISVHAEDNDGGSDGGSSGGSSGGDDASGHDAGDDNGADDAADVSDDDDAAGVNGKVGAVFDPSSAKKPGACKDSAKGC